MSETTAEDIKFWIGRWMKSEKIPEFDVEILGDCTKGDGYLGEITFAKVSPKKSGKCYNVVIKAAKKSDELRKQTPIKEAYDREIFIYNKIIPLLKTFQKNRAIEKPFDNTPKCFYVHSEEHKEAIILEDLRSLGFSVHDRKKAMNFEHISMVLRKYGQFHALSLALQHKQPLVFKELTKNMCDVLGRFVEQARMLPVFLQNFRCVLKMLEADGEIEVLKKYEKFEDQFEAILLPKEQTIATPAVILHGDCWNNNFIFKYEAKDQKKERPIEMIFLDFQLSRVASPAFDLSYFLYLCADKTILDNFDKLLRIYHSSLSEFLTELGCDPLELFPFETLMEQWRVFGKFGLVMSLFVLKISLCESNEGPDFAEIAEKGDGFENSFDIQMKDQNQYDQRIKDVYLHFAKKFL